MSRQQVAVDGNNYWHYLQQFANECGPSSVAMTIRILKNTLIDVAQARPAIAKFDPVHQSNFRPNWTTDPSEMTSSTQSLSSAGINKAQTRGREGAWLSDTAYRRILWQETRPQKPTIVRFDWGHFGVCVGALDTDICLTTSQRIARDTYHYNSLFGGSGAVARRRPIERPLGRSTWLAQRSPNVARRRQACLPGIHMMFSWTGSRQTPPPAAGVTPSLRRLSAEADRLLSGG
jgi:hypothetical protein